MSEHPIPFSGPMVRATLAGRKTNTRRICKKAYDRFGEPAGAVYPARDKGWISWWPATTPGLAEFTKEQYREGWPCPYGGVGDLLWVRECWHIGAWDEDTGCIAVDYRADGYSRPEYLAVPDDEMFERMWIQSTDDALAAGLTEDTDGKFHWAAGLSPCHWRPSIHMPRWASRITLLIESVRVERLRDITEADAIAEGAIPDRLYSDEMRAQHGGSEYICAFHDLWDSLNAKRGYGWSVSPWVWVIRFSKGGA